jgi:hypothetical protein
LALVASCFGGQDYLKTFPQVFGPDRTASLCVLTQNDQVVAALAVLKLCLRCPRSMDGPDFVNDLRQRELWFDCIGSVCTNPNHRQQGYASELLQKACAHLQSLGHAAAGLFAADPRMYAACGFVPAQPDRLMPLVDLMPFMDVAPPPALDIGSHFLQPQLHSTASLSGAACRQLELMAQACWTHERGTFSADHHLFFTTVQQTPMQVLTISQPDGHLCGALFYEKGADFQETWHGLLVAPDLRSQPERLSRATSVLLQSAYGHQPKSQILLDHESLRTPPVQQAIAQKKGSCHSVFMIRDLQASANTADEETNLWSQLALPSLLSI